jgi:lysophospholipase L1-like esterase
VTAARLLPLALLPVLLAQAPPDPALSNSARETLYQRTLQLLDASTVATPELARAGAPLIEDARQALTNLHAQPDNESFDSAFLTALRAFLSLTDAIPQPFPFPAEARDQLVELRSNFTRAQASFNARLNLQAQRLRSPDPADLNRYAAENARLPAPALNNPRIVFLGDSITDLWRLNEYFPGRDFLNRGISGQTSGQMLQRFQADVAALHPAAVVILAGTNDLARSTSLTAIEANLTSLVELSTLHGIRVVLAGLLPVGDAHKDRDPNFQRTLLRPPSSIKALNAWMQRLCQATGCTYLDYYAKMVDAKGEINAALSDDGLHPNSAGYRVMAPLADAAIAAALRPAQRPVHRRRFPL